MSLILVIDDDPQILRLVDAVLRYEGHSTLLASDGREGMAKFGEQVDLVITDLLMPHKEGFETIADIRRSGLDVPVIAITGGGAVGPQTYLETARLFGASVVIAKPFAKDEILVAVRSLLAEPVLH
jgi:CheY-like chemotaxis protein